MPNKKPFFSIITCTKNSAKFLPSCLSSLSSQVFRDFEHIVIDGESTDKTISLIPKSSQLFVIPPNGISAAMNAGIKFAKGKYIYFLHSDDYLEDDSVLSNVANFLQANPDLDWVYGQINAITADNKLIGHFPKHWPLQLASSYLLKYINFIPHQGVFMKKKVFDDFGQFSTILKSCMDYDYYLRIARVTKWSYIPIVVAKYRVHSGAQSSSLANAVLTHSESEAVQRLYQNLLEQVLSKLINHFLIRYNRTTS